MNDPIALIESLVAEAQAGRPVALCTVLKTRGSTPQVPGAMLLVLGDSNVMGTVGGGAVEAEVQRTAAELLQKPVDVCRVVRSPRIRRRARKARHDLLGSQLQIVKAYDQPRIPERKSNGRIAREDPAEMRFRSLGISNGAETLDELLVGLGMT